MPVKREKKVVEEATPAVKKRQKKPIKIVAVVTPDGIEGSFSTEPRRPLIAHLHAHSDKLDFNPNTSGPTASGEPEPYNLVTDDMFSGNNHEMIEQKLPEIKEEHVEATNVETTPLQCHVKVDLMTQFKETARAKVLPSQTEISCFWCSHKFDNAPCIIPEREVAGVYQVYGNFCMPECGLAYLLHESIDPHARWERIALLHRIYDRLGSYRIFPSPPRESLKIFGGPLSIESFRATVKQGKVRVDMHMPPMVSILGSIDTKPIDFFNSSIKNTLLGTLQIDKTTKAEEGLRLKRAKPLKDRESTLDSVMNIRSTARPLVK
jgi:hypothetical protein